MEAVLVMFFPNQQLMLLNTVFLRFWKQPDDVEIDISIYSYVYYVH